MMQKHLFFLLLLLPLSISYTQFSGNDFNNRNHFYQSKVKRYQQLMQAEQQKTANQENYDVKYYSLDLTPDPASETLNGEVQVVAEVLSSSLDFVDLNFYDGMIITEVFNSDYPATQLSYSFANDILTINLDSTYISGELIDLTIVYHGRPQDSEEYGWGFGFDTYDNQPMIWSFSQPWGARAWWPCKDVPSDKADSVDIRVTVPGELIVASNGSLIQKYINGDYTTYWWHEKYPIATYLVSIAIYPYELNYDDYIYNAGADTMKIHFYTFPGNYNLYRDINNKVKEMLAYFSELFGEYPFIDEKYGHADFSVGGAIEHQTCTSFHFWEEWVYAHELAHQWWGDMITYDSWHHTWLSEGLAVYSEALWYEYLNEPGSANDYQMGKNLYFGRGTVYVEDYVNFTNIIDNPFYPGLIYQKASWIFHMLRHIVGDDVFFDILKTYYASDHHYGTVTSAEFQTICEQVSGMDLNKFFFQWLHEEFFPVYSFTWDWIQNGTDYDIQLEIIQEQNNHIFWMPIDITVTTNNGETTFVVLDSLQTQFFQFSIESEPLNLELDKNNWILKQVQEPFTNPTFDEGLLIVNGVSFDVYGSEIWDAYENRTFWGDSAISFWDCFIEPQNGYPSTLPDPLGHGRVPASILGKFSTVIWIGNDYGGDLGSWLSTPILPYLESGGNCILITRRGQRFLNNDMQQYLGFTWREDEDNTINNCISTYNGLQNMSLNGPQTRNSVFDTSLFSNESTLLFMETSSFGVPRGLGVWRKPAQGGTYRSNGGQFVFISGRPYRYNSDQLKSNLEYIIQNIFQDAQSDDSPPLKYDLYPNYPNPFNESTTIEYDLLTEGKVVLKIYNVLGKEIRTLINEYQTIDRQPVKWDGKDNSGQKVSSGIYIYRIQSGEYSKSRKMVLLR